MVFGLVREYRCRKLAYQYGSHRAMAGEPILYAGNHMTRRSRDYPDQAARVILDTHGRILNNDFFDKIRE